MDFDEEPILCGRCRTVVHLETPSVAETIVRCPVCGESDTLEAARREASQHTAYAFLQHALWPIKAGAPEVRYRFHAENHLLHGQDRLRRGLS
ncbi:hypothetical protein DFR50_103126 [Roseiarcus fermentans]|uniref:Uncharacterized protein n=1 Tax=Roseiarcus fermentans TaxID=1473586 RepID=A0A366FRS7_9HYPH|nr:hypothetical protein [Roseiarcus fermentans]RBP17241.1 hypothetical protein DFR50_103126 [Roseiarcus fermentans]